MIHKLTVQKLRDLKAKCFTADDALDIYHTIKGSRGLIAWNSEFDKKALLMQCSDRVVDMADLLTNSLFPRWICAQTVYGRIAKNR